MKEILIIKTENSAEVVKILNSKNINYEIYQEPQGSGFSRYNQALSDKKREQEANELENAEEEDIINDDW